MQTGHFQEKLHLLDYLSPYALQDIFISKVWINETMKHRGTQIAIFRKSRKQNITLWLLRPIGNFRSQRAVQKKIDKNETQITNDFSNTKQSHVLSSKLLYCRPCRNNTSPFPNQTLKSGLIILQWFSHASWTSVLKALKLSPLTKYFWEVTKLCLK